jgi:hypothetical protein
VSVVRRCKRNSRVLQVLLERSGPTDFLALTVRGKWTTWLTRQPENREKLLERIGQRDRLSDEPSNSKSFVAKDKREECRVRDALLNKLRQCTNEGGLVSWSLIYETSQALRDAREWRGGAYVAARWRDEELLAFQEEQKQSQARLSRIGQKKSSPSRANATETRSAKLKRVAEKIDTVLREQKEVKELATTRVDNLTKPWNVLAATVERELTRRDPSLVVCVLRWLRSGFHWMMHVDKFGWTLSWDCEVSKAADCAGGRSSIFFLAVGRVTRGSTLAGVNGSGGPGVKFLLANSC